MCLRSGSCAHGVVARRSLIRSRLLGGRAAVGAYRRQVNSDQTTMQSADLTDRSHHLRW